MKKTNLTSLWCLIAVLLISLKTSRAQAPFSCSDGVSYQLRGNPSSLYTVNLRTGDPTLLFDAVSLGNRNLTGLGYNIGDNFLYASIAGTNDIVRIGSDGVITQIDVPDLPAATYHAGDIAPDGTLVLYTASATTMQRVNLGTLAVSTITLTGGANLQDIAISPDGSRIYGISNGNGNLISYPMAGGSAIVTNVGMDPISASCFMDATGDLFFISDGSSSVYEVSGPGFANANSVSRVTSNLGVPISNTDGARCTTSLATTQPSFSCVPNQAFVSTSGTLVANDCDAIGDGKSVLMEYDLASGAIVSTSGQLIQTFGTERSEINNLGYNPTDNFLWAYRTATNQLVRIGQDRSVDFFAIQGLSNNCLYPGAGNIDNTFFFSGDINEDGVMYLLNGILGDRFIRVDLNPSSPTYLTKLSDVLLNPINPGAGTLSSIQDLAFNPVDGLLYTISANGNLIRIDPITGLVTNVGTVSGIPSSAGGYVVAYFDNAGTLYVQKANDTSIIKVPDVAAGNLAGSTYGAGATFAGGDGARCAKTAIAPQLYTLSGNVFDDGNALNDAGGALVNTSGPGAISPVNGSNSLGMPLYVTLMNDLGTAIGTVPVGVNGTYLFLDVAPGSYATVLSVNPDGATVPNSPLPTDWNYTGEQLGTVPGGTDGTVDGIVSNITIVASNVVDANFGINRRPVVVDGTDIERNNPGGTLTSPVSAALFSGTDLEDTVYPNNLAGRLVDLEPGINGDLYYNGVLVTAGDPAIINFSPTLVTVDPAGASNQDITTVTFTYTVTDNAGVVSLPKTIQVPFIADPMPVKLISFVAKSAEQGSVSLEWATTEESNSNKFQIEHSLDAKIWNVLAAVAAKGYSKTLTQYGYTHDNPVKGQNFYRLKMIDQDETFAYSRIRSIQLSEIYYSSAVYPNPVSGGTLYIRNLSNSPILEIVVINASGQIVIKSGSDSTKRVAVNNLNEGLYSLRITHSDGTFSTHKVIITK